MLPDPLQPAIVQLPLALAVLAAAVPVNHSGGELVYRHRAANAYIDGARGELQRNADD